MKWTNSLDDELKRLIENHHNYGEISKIMKLSIKSLQNRAFRLGLKINLNVEIYCTNCGKKIKRYRCNVNENNNFCSSSCAAIYNNRNRICSDTTKEKIRNKLIEFNLSKPQKERNKTIKKIKTKKERNKIKKCKYCKNLIPIKKKICDNCKLTYYEYYRPTCEFKFNLNDYPDEFDFNLLENYEMYSPTNKKNNLNGISRDHMYSVRDGFINKISPEIIKHPANCKLMIHDENNKKHHNSSITIGELLDRIKNWDLKYNKI